MITSKLSHPSFTAQLAYKNWLAEVKLRLWYMWHWLNDAILRLICLLLRPFLYRTNANSKDFNLQNVRRVLVVSLDGIGDIVILTAFLRELKRNLPDAKITFLVKPPANQLVELCPYIDEVYTLVTNKPSAYRQWVAQMGALLPKLWAAKFDLAILPRWDIDIDYNAPILYLSGATQRIGYAENVTPNKQKFNHGYNRFFTQTITDTSVQHEAQRAFNLLRFMNGQVVEEQLEICLGAADENFAKQIINQQDNAPVGLLIALNPGARELKRMWPVDNFIEIAIWLQATYQAKLLIVGGEDERYLGEKLKSISPADTIIDLTGKTTLRQLCAIFKYCTLYLGNDTGPMHLAVAAGTPVIEISCHPHTGSYLHQNSPIRFGPWQVPTIVLQPETALPPCTNGCEADEAHCIKQVTLQQVKQALITQIANSPIGQSHDHYIKSN